jgi:hypothetical protein
VCREQGGDSQKWLSHCGVVVGERLRSFGSPINGEPQDDGRRPLLLGLVVEEGGGHEAEDEHDEGEEGGGEAIGVQRFGIVDGKGA